ncbi:proteasome activator subunit 4-like isoform X3 [Nymphaea colorata]|uniref:proteasome activator subunit 4-like isoform X3 n=1 Tax=Nymphaea colorata TaxID=210225 RepID=UPI00129D6AC2|nr:proteasome activator subunit 4-like isoform X3 [Nymphaea colorata]
MHLYNAWLPPPVAEKCKDEARTFGLVVRSVRDSWLPDSPDSVYSTLKWISIIDLYLEARSEILLEDVKALIEIGFDIFLRSHDKLFVQVRWGNILIRLLKKYKKSLTLKVPWRPLYSTLLKTHLARNPGAEGWSLREQHFKIFISLVQCCRAFFPSGSAAEIWSEFEPFLDNPWHGSSFEGLGLISLFLPTNSENQAYISNSYIQTCLDLWVLNPHSEFWEVKWADLIGRCIRNCSSVDWEGFLPEIFTHYMNMFEVPVENENGVYPFPLEAPNNNMFLYLSVVPVAAKVVAKSIVYLLKPGGSAQEFFGKLATRLEQFYHPSNDGHWTDVLEAFLYYLVITFKKRLEKEQQNLLKGKNSQISLGKSEQVAFIKVVLRFIVRAQYNEDKSFSEVAAASISILSYIEPSLMIPSMISRFHLALETLTTTHQVPTAMTAVAFTARALFFCSLADSSSTADIMEESSCRAYGDFLALSLSNALLGIDANDPSKTSASIQLIVSMFSNLSVLDDDGSLANALPSINFSKWLDEFLQRLFSIFLFLEPSNTLNEGAHQSLSSSGTFLLSDKYYFPMLVVLLGRLSKHLHKQALEKISKFLRTNILPGSAAEIGLLCCAAVHSNPEAAAVYVIDPILTSIVSSLQGTPVSGFGGGTYDVSYSAKSMLPPALEIATEYHLHILALAIRYGGSFLLQYREQLKEITRSAFDAPSWKVNLAGDTLLCLLLRSLVHYYPIDQYRCFSCHPVAGAMEEWVSRKDYRDEYFLSGPNWHIPSDNEVLFANELLDLHLNSPLDVLLNICQSKSHGDRGLEREHLKVLLLRISSSLEGVQSCLPDFRSSLTDGPGNEYLQSQFIVGETGATVGSPELREKAARIVHISYEYLLKERPDDSMLLRLVTHIMDFIGNYGSMEYERSNNLRDWDLDASIIEPPVNFIIHSCFEGKKRPQWVLANKVHMHNTWRSSQSSYHLFHVNDKILPSKYFETLMDDLLNLSLHNFKIVRVVAVEALQKMFKRFPSLVVKCIPALTKCLLDPNTPEHKVLGACTVLKTRGVLRQLTLDSKAFSTFLLGVLGSSHHESLKAQEAIRELFDEYNIQYDGASKNPYNAVEDASDVVDIQGLVSTVSCMSFRLNSLHWRYSLMANWVLLLLLISSRSLIFRTKFHFETIGCFLKSLRNQVPQTRILAISALNVLLTEFPNVPSVEKTLTAGSVKSPLEDALGQVFLEDGFFVHALNYLSDDHDIPDMELVDSTGNYGMISSDADKLIRCFCFDRIPSWPRTPSWIFMTGGDSFCASFAYFIERLVQECGEPVVLSLRSSLEEFSFAEERAKQCVAAEALAGILHSDISEVQDSWKSWILSLVEKIILEPVVDSTPDWTACIRYAVTGKGRHGTEAPDLRHKVLECLMNPLPQIVKTSTITKRYYFLAAALAEMYPSKMQSTEVELHDALLKELLECMDYSSSQVREAIGVTLSVLCSNMALFISCRTGKSHHMQHSKSNYSIGDNDWCHYLIKRASELALHIQSAGQPSIFANDDTQEETRWMETLFHFVISSFKSGRSPFLFNIIVGVLHPIISLQGTPNEDLSCLANEAFELLIWHTMPQACLKEAVVILLSSSNNSNWRTRLSTLSYLRHFMYRHIFLLSVQDKQQIWMQIEMLLKDSQVEVREHAATVLADLMNSGDEDLAGNFRHRAYEEAFSLYTKRKLRNLAFDVSSASLHGSVLALVALVLSVPYDMPRLPLLLGDIDEPLMYCLFLVGLIPCCYPGHTARDVRPGGCF